MGHTVSCVVTVALHPQSGVELYCLQHTRLSGAWKLGDNISLCLSFEADPGFHTKYTIPAQGIGMAGGRANHYTIAHPLKNVYIIPPNSRLPVLSPGTMHDLHIRFTALKGQVNMKSNFSPRLHYAGSFSLYFTLQCSTE